MQFNYGVVPGFAEHPSIPITDLEKRLSNEETLQSHKSLNETVGVRANSNQCSGDPVHCSGRKGEVPDGEKQIPRWASRGFSLQHVWKERLQ